MLPESKVQEIHDFANLFFYRVVDRLKQAGAPDKEYVQPKINLFRSLDQEERYRLEELMAPINFRIYKEDLQYTNLSEEENASRQRTLAQELLTEEERTELSELEKRDKWGKSISGVYDNVTNNIALDESVWKDSWGTLAHELLHAVRYKVLDKPEKNSGYDYMDNMTVVLGMAGLKFWEDLAQIPNTKRKSESYVFIPAEVIELFGELESIVRVNILQDYSEYAKATEWSETSKLNLYEKSYEFFRGGIKARFSKMVSNVVALHKKMLGCKGDLDLTDTPEYEMIYSESLNRGRDIPYLHLVGGIPLERIVCAYTKYNRLLQKTLKCQGRIKKRNTSKINWDNGMFASVDEPKEAERITQCLNVGTSSEDQTEQRYWIARLAINEYQSEFAKSWPQIFLMPGIEVEERYIAPIRKRIEELRAPL